MTSLTNTILSELKEAEKTLNNFLNNAEKVKKIEEAAQLIVSAIKDGKKVISCGNGGSHCDAMHFAEELTGRYRQDRPAIAAIAISDVSHISCVGNDYGYDFIFSRYLEAIGQDGDILLAISTSGNSRNILKAAETAKKKNIKVISLTGKDGGQLAKLSDLEIRVEHFGFADRIQEIHIKIIHILILLIEQLMFDK
jgi:D-sedoheptulose 7-phosphate isomerase